MMYDLKKHLLYNELHFIDLFNLMLVPLIYMISSKFEAKSSVHELINDL